MILSELLTKAMDDDIQFSLSVEGRHESQDATVQPVTAPSQG
jgi:hypothetical protein